MKSKKYKHKYISSNIWVLHSALRRVTVESVRCRRPTTILRICYSQHVEGPRSNEKMPNPLSLPGQKAASQEVLKIRDASSLLLLHLCQLHKLWVIHSPHSAVIWLSAPKWQACFSIICPSTRLFSMEKMNTCMQECIQITTCWSFGTKLYL